MGKRRDRRRVGVRARRGVGARLGVGAEIVWLAVAVLGCQSVPVTTELEPGAELSGLRSYVLVPPAAESLAAPYDERIAERVEREIVAALDEKGFRAAPAAEADLQVGFRLSAEPQSRVVNVGDPDADFYEVERYVEGTVRIAVSDAAGRPLWRGRSTSELLLSGRLITTDVEATAVEQVRAILAEFPPEGSVAR